MAALNQPRAVVARQPMLAGGEAVFLPIIPENPWRTARTEIIEGSSITWSCTKQSNVRNLEEIRRLRRCGL